MIYVYIHAIFSSVYKIVSGMDHKLGHRTSLGKFKKTETISSIFSDHNTMRLEINYRKKKLQKSHKRMETKQYITKLIYH